MENVLSGKHVSRHDTRLRVFSFFLRNTCICAQYSLVRNTFVIPAPAQAGAGMTVENVVGDHYVGVSLTYRCDGFLPSQEFQRGLSQAVFLESLAPHEGGGCGTLWDHICHSRVGGNP